jgi:hypothetical protein
MEVSSIMCQVLSWRSVDNLALDTWHLTLAT